MTDQDPGDEDDLSERNEVGRMFAGWRFRMGPTRIYYAAYRLPSMPEHDPGDEHPQLKPLPGLLSYCDSI